MASDYETMRVLQDGRRVSIVLDRPAVMNAQNEAFLREILEITSGLVDRDDFDVVAVRSSGDHWCSGLDMKAVSAGWRLDRKGAECWELALRHLETMPQLVVALIDGYCLGGGLQLALACDVRVATERSTLAIPAARELGFLAGLAPWRLPRLLGTARAKALLLGGAVLSGRQAASWGVVDQVVPVGGLEAAWEELVAPLGAATQASVGECKRIIEEALDTGHAEALADLLDVQDRLLASEGAKVAQEEAIALLRSGKRLYRHVGWFPLGEG